MRPAVAVALAGALGAAAILGGLGIAERIVLSWGQGAADDLVWVEAVYTLAVFLPIMMGAVIGAMTMRSPGLRLGERPVARIWRGLAVGLGGMFATTVFAWLAGILQPASVQQAGVGALMLGSLLILLQVASEEVLLRGWVQPVLGERLPGWSAVLIAALLFAALHILGGVRAPMSLLNLLLGGLLFGLLALRTGGLAAPIAAHFAWNWSEMILLGLSPNPGVSGYGSIWNLDLAGSPLWGGSDEGLNISIGTAAVLVALLLLLVGPRARTV